MGTKSSQASRAPEVIEAGHLCVTGHGELSVKPGIEPRACALGGRVADT